MNGNARFIAVTSGCGGVGTTSLAVALGRILARLHEMNVLYVSFELLSSKSSMPGGMSERDFLEYYEDIIVNREKKKIDITDDVVTDSYGLNYLKCDGVFNPMHSAMSNVDAFLIQMNLNYDAVILDVPVNSAKGLILFPLCESVVMNYGTAQPHRKKYCDEFLKFIMPFCHESRFHSFSCGFDEFSFKDGDVDIHGEFGAEVRRLAAEIGF